MKSSLTTRGLLAASVLLAAMGQASAGECPAGKAGANALAGAPTAPVGITDTTLGFVDLAGEKLKAPGRQVRLRMMTIAPGGIVPLHDHADRPAVIHVAQGEIIEHSSKCMDALVHKAGESSLEKLGLMHWWENKSGKPVVLYIADIPHMGDKAMEQM